MFQEPDRLVHPPSWLEHIPFAFWMIDALRPATFVELGTHSGNSYSSFAQAVQTLGLDTACYAVDTWQGDPQAGFYDEGVFAEWAEYHNRHFAAFSRLVRATFAEAATHFPDGSVDLLHLDGCHTYESAAADFDTWRPKLSRRAVVLIHDVNVRERDFGTWRLWEQLKSKSPHFEFLHGHGLGVLGAGSEFTEPLQWLFSRDTSSDDVRAIRQFFARLGGATSARYAAGEGLIRESRERAEAVRLHAEEIDRRTRLETQSKAQDRIITRLRDELTGRFAQTTQDALRVESLARQVENAQRALTRQARLSAQLQERLNGETIRRKHAEETHDSHSGLKGAPHDQMVRAESWLRRRVRHARRISRFPVALGLWPPTRTARSGLTFLADSRRLRDAYAIFQSGLFDEGYYRRRYPDVASSRLTPLAHFVLLGAREGRSPHPLFDAGYYLRTNPDVAATRANPLLHFLGCGAFEGRAPHPLFDVEFYLRANPDVRNARVDPLSHFIRFGAADGRNPHPLFDTQYYLRRYPDVVQTGTNPLIHFVSHGGQEGRSPSAAFDTAYYLAQNEDVRVAGENALVHFVTTGRSEGRSACAAGEQDGPADGTGAEERWESPPIELRVTSLAPRQTERPTILCLTHVMPLPPRAGNEYRIYRMLRWLRQQGYRIVLVVAPLPGEPVEARALHPLADEFSNVVLCDRDGRVEYILRDVPDVLASLDGEVARPIALLLDEDAARTGHERDLLRMDRLFCHDAVVTTVLRLHEVLGPYVLLAEYIWMSRILPLLSGDVVKVIDTIDVFSTKRAKVLQFGIDDLHVDPREEAKRMRHADLVVAIQDEESRELRQLAPGRQVVTAGVDFDVVEDPGVPSGRRVLYVGSGNPMNRKGLLDFVRFAWPQIRQAVPDAELILAGRVGDALDVDVPGIVRLGLVDDLDPVYAQARVVINPAVAGTGLKIKTLEALTHLRPIVTWPSGGAGLAPELAAFCVTVHDWFDFSHRVTDLLATDEPRVFSRTERETIVRLTSAAMVYGDMTAALASLREKRFGVAPAGFADRV